MAVRTTRKTAGKVSARDRARAAKARLDAQRADRERRIEDAATAYYAAVDARDEALAVAAQREQDMADAVGALQEDGETVDRIADLCETSAKEVRRLLRLGGGADTGDDAGNDTAPGESDDAAENGSAVSTTPATAPPVAATPRSSTSRDASSGQDEVARAS